mmetsp:Transcript_9984/g.14128  ORF Transcript_9984/g.14128 Transcript_9984/m.14128 type:complete len:381 (+) Transcript_9984:119-1261(+)
MMQRKNAKTPKVLTPQSGTKIMRPITMGNAPIGMASVVRRRCGTSPFDKNWLNMDCCGLFCACITYFLHLYGAYAVCAKLVPSWMCSLRSDGICHLSFWGFLHCSTFCIISFLAMASHFKAMTTDPGSVPPDAKPIYDDVDGAYAEGKDDGTTPKPKQLKRMCRRCNTFKPRRAHHCSICQRCIIKMDHHCPWVNNCVGIGNHKYFLLFIFYTFLSCLYSIILVTVRFFQCMSANQSKEMHCLDRPSDLLYLMFLTMESILFGLFTSCMILDQWDVVLTNVTHIDRLKGDLPPLFGDESSNKIGISEVFGAGSGVIKSERECNWRWISPFVKVCFPEPMKNEIFGFCQPVPTTSVCETLSSRQDKEVALSLMKDKGVEIV